MAMCNWVIASIPVMKVLLTVVNVVIREVNSKERNKKMNGILAKLEVCLFSYVNT